MFRFLENFLAVIGLLAILGFAAFGVMALEERTQPQLTYLEPRMRQPAFCDATVSQRGAGEKWKTRCYVRKEN